MKKNSKEIIKSKKIKLNNNSDKINDNSKSEFKGSENLKTSENPKGFEDYEGSENPDGFEDSEGSENPNGFEDSEGSENPDGFEDSENSKASDGSAPAFTGLTDREIRERKEQGYVNVSTDIEYRSVKRIIYENVFTYFNLIFAVLAVLLIIAGAFRELTFLPVIISNTLIGIVQELRAKRVIDNLTMLNIPKVKTLRNSEIEYVIPENLVRDDICVFSAGNQIPADARVISGEAFVNEALLTGESDEIRKVKGSELMSGSFIVSGECYAVLTKVGSESYISKLTAEAKKVDNSEQSEMIKSLNNIVKIAGIVIIPVGLLLFYMAFFKEGNSFKESMTSMAAAVIGMIPEGLYLLASVAMVVSTMRLASKKVLLHDMKCIETLSRVDILCVDKTGTITEPEMKVYKVIPADSLNSMNSMDSLNSMNSMDSLNSMNSMDSLNSMSSNASMNSMDSKDSKGSKNLKKSKDKDINVLINDFVAAMDNDNATMAALKKHFSAKSKRKIKEKFPFSSEKKCSSVIFSDGIKYTLGAPEFLLGSNTDKYNDIINKYANRGMRVLAFCRNNTAKTGYNGDNNKTGYNGDNNKIGYNSDNNKTGYNGDNNKKGNYSTDDFNENDMSPLAFIVLSNPIRKGAKETFSYFNKQGVTVKVISGDNPVTVSKIAMDAGIKNASKYVDASTINTMDEMLYAVKNYTVFGRVKPEQKRQIVKLFKSLGHTVAMTGDGVNDILALKDADCSVAMASGSEAAARCSSMVLLNNDFSTMPDVVYEGRRVVNNIERSSSLFLVKNFFSLFLSILTMVLMISYPLKPSQVSLISMFTIGVPGFFLSLEPNKNMIKGSFIRNVLIKALPAAVTDILAVGSFMIFGYVFKLKESEISTASTLIILVVGFLILFKTCKPLNKYRFAVFTGCIIAVVFSLIYLRWWFSITYMSPKCIMIFILFGISSESVYRFIAGNVERINSRL